MRLSWDTAVEIASRVARTGGRKAERAWYTWQDLPYDVLQSTEIMLFEKRDPSFEQAYVIYIAEKLTS